MQDMLQSEGVYGDLCPGVDVKDCNAATIKYNAIFNAGSFGSTGGAILFGILSDRFGSRASSVLGHSLLLIGCVMLAFSTSTSESPQMGVTLARFSNCNSQPTKSCPAADMFLPAYLLLGLGGNPIQLSCLPICNEFKRSATAMTVYSGVVAASASVFGVLRVCADTREVITLTAI